MRYKTQMDDTTDLQSINYELLVEDALRSVVRGALSIAQHAGLPGESHFYVTFLTDAPGVSISDTLKAGNPKEMTIVLQHQFWDLDVFDDRFHITLSFSGTHEPLIIPFSAVTHFTDPSVGFGLQFSEPEIDNELMQAEDSAVTPPKISTSTSLSDITPSLSKNGQKRSQADHDDAATVAKDTAEIVSLDTFRKEP
jgi:hypothetical protein